jgi:hypothetical protein
VIAEAWKAFLAWKMVGVVSARWVMIGFLVVALAALGGAGLVTRDVTAKRPLETQLQADGQVVAATVVEVSNRGQYGIAREVRVRLADGRLTEVDLTNRRSNDGVREGSVLRVLVDPRDPLINRPVDAAPLGERWWPSTAPLIAVAAGAVILCLAAYRASRKQR